MNPTTRRMEIAERLRLEGEASIESLAASYGTSEMTIRRDLDFLEEEGLARRARGGAIYLQSRAHDPPVHQRASVQASAKAAIGLAAAGLVGEGETIILDIGTTTAAMARALNPDLSVTVVTHSLLIANEVAAKPGVGTILTGGTLRPGELSMVGPMAIDAFRQYNCDTLYMGVGGVDLERGFSDASEDDAAVKRAALAAVRRVVVLADASKLGRVCFARVASLEAADVVVTDAPGHHPAVGALRERGVEVVLVCTNEQEGAA
ncbi:MAG: DeoR/GlpR family DNA-binding transcription regulator [Acidimicrobiales bacterium]